MRMVIYDKNGKIEDIIDLSRMFRKDGSMLTFVREQMAKALNEGAGVFISKNNTNLPMPDCRITSNIS